MVSPVGVGSINSIPWLSWHAADQHPASTPTGGGCGPPLFSSSECCPSLRLQLVVVLTGCVCSFFLAPTTLTLAPSWHTHAHTGATLLSFVVALVHFITEVLIFKTMSIKGAATPMAIAGEGAHRSSSSRSPWTDVLC